MKILGVALLSFSITLPTLALAQNNPGNAGGRSGGSSELVANPSLVRQILRRAGSNPTPQSIASAANEMAGRAADPVPILAAALVASREAGLPPAGLIAISPNENFAQVPANSTNAAPADISTFTFGGMTADPATVAQILQNAGPNPTAASISQAANALAAGAGDTTPILAAALAAAKSVGIPPAGLVALVPSETYGNMTAEAYSQSMGSSTTSLAGITADPAVVEQIKSEAGPNPTADSIAQAASTIAARSADPAPILAAALVAGKDAGLPPAGLVNISRTLVTAHAATPAASNATVGTMIAVTEAALPPGIAARAIPQIVTAAVATNPTLSPTGIQSAAATVAANAPASTPGTNNNPSNNPNDGSTRGPNPSVMAANVPGGGSGGGGSNQIFNAPSATPTPYGN